MDQLCRWGGEEFLALVPGVTAERLVDIAERIRLSARKAPVMVGAHRIPVTLSAGVVLSRPGCSATERMAKADALLYQAKREGRDRIAFESPLV